MNCALGHAIKVGINVISGLFGHLASDVVEDISLYLRYEIWRYAGAQVAVIVMTGSVESSKRDNHTSSAVNIIS